MLENLSLSNNIASLVSNTNESDLQKIANLIQNKQFDTKQLSSNQVQAQAENKNHLGNIENNEFLKQQTSALIYQKLILIYNLESQALLHLQ